MKKLAVILLSLCLLLSLCGAAAAESDAAVWYYNEYGVTAYIEGELQGDVIIPDNIDGYAVTALDSSALSGQHGVTSLTLPDTMYALQSGAIARMDNLQSVTLNEGLEVIGLNNFCYCPSLTSLTIPASVKLIESNIAVDCENLREIRFEGVCPVFVDPSYCFDWLADDYVIYVPDDQLDAYAEVFADTYGVAEHLQPSGKNAVIPEAQNTEDWFDFDAETGTITGYKEYHAYVEIPASIDGVPVKHIGESAAQRDYSIYALVFPEGLESIGPKAFSGDYNTLYISFPASLKEIGDEAFSNAQTERVAWSEGLETIGAMAFQYHHESVLTLPSTVKTIGEGAFERSRCSELHLSGDLESIGSRAFADSSISYMAFDFYEPIEIAGDAFAETNVADLDLPWDSSFENQAAYAEMLREQCPDCTVWINNPESSGVAEHPVNDGSITKFENGVLTMYKGDQPDLTLWTGYDDIPVTALGDGVFKGNQTIRSFYPHHCGWFTTIGNEAFADSTVEYVELFGSITTIGSGAFRNCLNLTELTLPASLTSIGEDALAGCENLQKLTVLCDPAILPDGLLDECFAHTEIYAAPDATDEQVRILSEKAHRPWYAQVSRVGEQANDLIEMPYAMLPMDDFWYDTEYARLDRYHGYELNLYLPREAEGMTLTMIGGDMMGRARGGDNYEMELPVRSVVIPENYTNILSTSFANCETLETVICYAPLDTTSGMFEGCTNLRHVVFVNGVRSLGRGVFYGCDKLETVYVGPYVEEVDGEAFIGCPGFDLSKCITDPAQMPDVDALLAEVKSDPMPEPTPAPTPAPAVPVGEAGAPYVGLWRADTLEMEGEVYPVAAMGAEMYLTLNADGTAESYDGETSETGTWTIENDVIMIGGAIEGMMPMTVNEAGQLVMEADGMKLVFAKEGGEAAPVPTTEAPAAPEAPAAQPTGDNAAYVGIWQAVTLEMEGESYPVADMGMEMYLTLNADGTAEFFDGETSEIGMWTLGDGVLTVTEVPLSIAPDSTLFMEEDGMKLVFAKADGTAPAAPAVPETAAPAEPTVVVTGNAEDYIGTWHADTLEMEGEVYPVAAMGMEMYFTLNADGTAESYDGEMTETSTWTFENGAAVVDGVVIQITGDGRLLMEDEDSKLFFVKGEGEAAPATPDVAVGTEDGFIGTWYGCYMATGAMNGDPRFLFDLTLTVYADGTANLVYPTDEPWHWTENADGSLLMVKDSDGTEMPLTMLDDGFICFGKMDGDGNAFGGYLIFSRDASAVWTPEMLAQAAPETETASAAGSGDRMEVRYVCTSAEAGGVTLDAALLGGEYALTFHANGTVDFVMVGNTIPGLKWTQGDGSFVIDYYGNTLEAVLTETGLDLDYFGSMLMHFAPAE